MDKVKSVKLDEEGARLLRKAKAEILLSSESKELITDKLAIKEALKKYLLIGNDKK